MDTEQPVIDARLAQLTLDANNSTPLYIQLGEQIANAVRAGVWRAEEALPSERTISEQLGVSRVTSRKAIETLINQGMLQRRRGSGTYVIFRQTQATTQLVSFSTEITQRGLRPKSVWIEKLSRLASKAESLSLGISSKDRVLVLARQRFADDEIFSVERALVPGWVIPDPDRVDQSLYKAMAAEGVQIERAIQRIRAINADKELAMQAGVAIAEAMLQITRTSYDKDGRIVEITDTFCRSDRYDFVAEITADSLGNG
ncbi:MAG: GntR family transcriptional regulator [Gammaproteobacteria bacterium]|nr:GntR family transcriptional regulator [Gammaproteobacteria bacterium]